MTPKACYYFWWLIQPLATITDVFSRWHCLCQRTLVFNKKMWMGPLSFECKNQRDSVGLEISPAVKSNYCGDRTDWLWTFCPPGSALISRSWRNWSKKRSVLIITEAHSTLLQYVLNFCTFVNFRSPSWHGKKIDRQCMRERCECVQVWERTFYFSNFTIGHWSWRSHCRSFNDVVFHCK